jgi:hypothetical protein
MQENNKIEVIILAPHYDDEIIGCYKIINNPLIKPIIIYMQDDEERKQESLKLKTHIPNIQVQLFQKNIPPIFLNPKNLLYFPDPYFEFHPDHRKWGAQGEDFLRQGLNVIFYNINMQAPYIHEVKDFKGKRRLLEKVYPSQKNLWRYEAKYYLFEGYNKWII